LKTRIIIFCIITICLINTSLSAQIPTNGLVAYYPFNGNANDESGNGNNGIVYGATLTTDRCGNPNSAYYFDGISNYISLNPVNNFIGLNNYSVCFWTMPTIIPTNAGGIIFGFGSNSTAYEQGLSYNPDLIYYAGSYNIGNNPIESQSQSCSCYYPNQWVFIVITRNSEYINLYINGTLVAPQTLSSINGQSANYGTGGLCSKYWR
jgi:hypothetical protein